MAHGVPLPTQKLNFLRIMEKNLLIENLKTKAGIDNLSDRTYDEVATVLLPMFADDEKITDESWSIPLQMLKSMSGQLRHEVADGISKGKAQWENEQKTAQQKSIDDAVSAFKAQWEKDHASGTPPVEEGKPDIAALVAEQVKAQMEGLTGENSEFAKLSKQFSDYLKLQAEKDKAAAEADVRSQIKDFLIGRGVDEDDYALEIMLEKLVIGDKPDVAALKAKAEKEYEAIYKRMHKGENAQPFAGGGGGGGNAIEQEIDAWAKRRDGIAASEAAAAAELEKQIFK